MEIRKLGKEEHGRTRALWERIFAEDTKAFLDYYYTVKTDENEIYVAEDAGEICAMLQLNPYELKMRERRVRGHYIIAVATDERYRRRGIMAALLKRAQQDMKEAGEPFTFLMPAAERIYYPHGFRYIYRQRQGEIRGKKDAGDRWTVCAAKKEDCGRLAEFAERILKERYEVYACRDAHYYETLLKEQESEQGGILLVKEKERMVGFFAYAKGETYEVREPLFEEDRETAFAHAVYTLTGNESECVRCTGYGTEEKPMIMAKILDVPAFFRGLKLREPVELTLEITEEPGGESLGRFRFSGEASLEVGELGGSLRAAALGDGAERISVGALTSIAFGYCDIENLGLTEYLQKELGKIEPLSGVFFNEVV